jgi:hypothetical protein
VVIYFTAGVRATDNKDEIFRHFVHEFAVLPFKTPGALTLFEDVDVKF